MLVEEIWTHKTNKLRPCWARRPGPQIGISIFGPLHYQKQLIQKNILADEVSEL